MTHVPATCNGFLVAGLGENRRIIDLSDKINERPLSTKSAQHEISKKIIRHNIYVLQWLTETAPNIIYDSVLLYFLI